MALALRASITPTGMNQGDLYNLLSNIVDIVNELQEDHATNKTMTDELNLDGDRTFADLTAIRAAVVAITAKLDADGGVTDTNYAATCNPAALTNTAIAATNVATITNSTALSLLG